MYNAYYPTGYVPWLAHNPYTTPYTEPVQHYEYPSSPSVCLDYLKGVCTDKRYRCKFAHPPLPDHPTAPVLPAQEYEAAQICSVWMLTGFCKFGTKCRFFHPPIDESTALCAPAITTKMVAFMTKQQQQWSEYGAACAEYADGASASEGVSSEGLSSDYDDSEAAATASVSSAEAASSPASAGHGAWTPQCFAQKESDALDAIVRKVNGILNRITLEKFDSLAQQLVDLVGQDEAILGNVLPLLFDKGCTEEAFGEMYSRLCKRLFAAAPQGHRALMSAALLDLARGIVYGSAEATDTLCESALAKFQAKRVSSIRFLGQLFLDNLLDTTNLLEIIDTLSHQCCGHPDSEAAANIELLCKLLTHVGQRLDTTWKDVLEPYYGMLQTIAPHQSGRVQVLIKNLLELRAEQKWVPRREEEKPKRITNDRRGRK